MVNRLFYLFYVIASSFVGLITLPLIDRYLSDYQLGMYALINSFFQLCIIIPNYSINATIIRFFSKYIHQSKSFINILNAYLAKFILIFILLIIAAMSFYNYISNSFKTMDIVIVILIFISFLLFKNSLSYLQSLEYKKQFTLFALTELITRLIFMVVLLIFYNHYLVPFIAMIISTTISFILSRLYLNKVIGELEESFDDDKIDSNEIQMFIKPLIMSGIFMWVLSSADQYIIDIFLGKEQTGYYLKAYIIPFQLIIIFNTAYMMYYEPIMSKYHNSNDQYNLKKERNISRLLILVYATFFILIGIFYSSDIYKIIYGSQMKEANFVFIFITIGATFWSFYKIEIYEVMLLNKVILSTTLLLIASIINIIANIVLVPKFGINGAAFSTLLSYFILYISSYIIVKRYKKGVI
ncbi:oligosaccharide flippase family protein [Macrococcoides canis]|uniref:Polysaccharide biosynthesis protein n=1 Tax=Macrococcoides canis TaxID=1855823 RepID=A0A1W7AAE9_9STAP|nr:oligosaccharide flippase family protein [Macrococcus canis]ARQ06538.1 Polysaccharide biosynthesis protein [Macrococcus canis]